MEAAGRMPSGNDKRAVSSSVERRWQFRKSRSLLRGLVRLSVMVEVVSAPQPGARQADGPPPLVVGPERQPEPRHAYRDADASTGHEDDGPGGPAARLAVLREAFITEAAGAGRWDVLARLDQAAAALERELGRTPMSRARLNVAPPAEVDEMDTWLDEIDTWLRVVD